ncbi:MAG: DNA polymerase domain-containing protein, partial [Ferruginibacter sp.]
CLLLPLIYNITNKKHLSVTPMSMLSYDQFCNFYSGLIDGDGNIANALNLCNFEKCSDDYLNILQQTLLWNNVIAVTTKNNIRIPFILENQKFINDLTVTHPDRKVVLKNSKFFNKKNRISNKIKYFIDGDQILVKVKKIFKTNRVVEMSDFETDTHYFNCNGIKTHNCESFDIPYIINRITNLFDDDKAKELSPVGQLWCRDGVIKRFGKVESKWTIKGISLIDYMELYKVNSRQQQESYSLGAIGEAELGIGKVKIDATNLSTGADTNWQQFIEYNIQDVYILERLENKLQFLALTRMLAYTGLTNFEQALGTISIVTGAIAAKALERNQIIATFNNKSQGNYEGGYVKDPVRGMSEAVVSFDVNSLYPNTIVTLNLSPETKLGKINHRENGKVSFSLINGKAYDIDQDKFDKFLTEKKIAVSKSNVLFSQKQQGICPSLIDSVYKKRVDTRNQLKEVKKKLSKIKDKNSKDYLDQKFISGQLDVTQYTLKIFLNRIYGCFANRYSPFYDIDLASSITLTGQECIKEAGNIADRFLVNNYGDTGASCILYSDTDSLYLTIKPTLGLIGKTFTSPENENKITTEAHKIVNDLEQHLNTEINKWANTELHSVDSRLEFKREAICDVGIFLEKKRYILHILDEEGISCDKTKYVGVEVASTNVPKKVKPLIKKIVETMIKTKSQSETNKAFTSAYDKFKKLSIEDMAFPKGINSFKRYAPLATDLHMGKRTPIGVKASITYNHFLDKLNISNKYEKIRGGGKIKFFYTTKNKWRVETIAFIDEYPKEFELRPDIDKMFQKSVVAAVERLYHAIKWRMISPTHAVQTDLFDLLG